MNKELSAAFIFGAITYAGWSCYWQDWYGLDAWIALLNERWVHLHWSWGLTVCTLGTCNFLLLFIPYDPASPSILERIHKGRLLKAATWDGLQIFFWALVMGLVGGFLVYMIALVLLCTWTLGQCLLKTGNTLATLLALSKKRGDSHAR